MAKKREPYSGLTGQQAADLMLQMEQENEQLRKFWYMDCPLKRAVIDHISSAPECFVLPRASQCIVSRRGKGPDITWRNARAHSRQGKDPWFSVDIAITYFKDSEYYYQDDPETVTRTYYVQFPLSLVSNFTKKEFSAWLRRNRERVRAERRDDAIEALKAIEKEMPSHRKELKALIKDMKQRKTKKKK